MGRVPRSLTKKYAELARERKNLKARLAEVESELTAVVYALKLVSPGWTAPKALPRSQKRVTALPRGGVATACLEALRRQNEMTTPELVRVARGSTPTDICRQGGPARTLHRASLWLFGGTSERDCSTSWTEQRGLERCGGDCVLARTAV